LKVTGTGSIHRFRDFEYYRQANAAPVLTYASPYTAVQGNGLTISPATGPSDNGTVTSIVRQPGDTYSGGFAVDNTTGVITLTNAAPTGSHTITIRITDNCNSFVDAQFMLNVNTCPTTFTVNSNGDASDSTPGDGTCATAGAVCHFARGD